MNIATAFSLVRSVILALLIAAILPAGIVRAAEFPSGPIKWIIPYPSGGSYDALSRGLAPVLRKEFKVPVLVNIIPGPDGYNQIIHAKPDGQTIGMSEPLSVYATAMLTNPNYNVDDLTWLGRVNASVSVIVASKKSGITSFEQLKTHKGPVRAGAFGVTTPILQEILLADAAKFEIAPVNFRTIGEMIFGTLRGDVDISLLGTTPWLKHIEAGNVVPILIWDDHRDPALPNVPCLKDVGLEKLVIFLNHRGVVVPPHVPDNISRTIVAKFQAAVSGGEGRAFLEKAKFETNQMWGKEFQDVIVEIRAALKRAEPTIRQLATSTK
jgi:tripartite-type tricarboxylate transporter receptor subunit TctC